MVISWFALVRASLKCRKQSALGERSKASEPCGAMFVLIWETSVARGSEPCPERGQQERPPSPSQRWTSSKIAMVYEKLHVRATEAQADCCRWSSKPPAFVNEFFQKKKETLAEASAWQRQPAISLFWIIYLNPLKKRKFLTTYHQQPERYL